MQKQKEAILILHNVRSKINVGSIFRTADAVGITKIYLTGYTPAPLDRFGRVVKEIAKSALGAEKTVSWEKTQNIKKVLVDLKKKKFQIIAVEQSKKSIDYKKVKIKFLVAFIFGNEVTGISEEILKSADVIVEIPMKGDKESLNVAVSVGVALFRILGV